MDSIDEWRRCWIQERVQCRRQPAAFWQEIVEAFLAGRKSLHSNPRIPVGRYAWNHLKALEMIIARNNQGVALDHCGNAEAALVVYEISIGDSPTFVCAISIPSRGWPEDGRRVYRAYIALQQRPDSASA